MIKADSKSFPSLFFLLLRIAIVAAFGVKTPVSELLKTHADDIAYLKESASAKSAAPEDEVFYLRYCMEFNGGKKGNLKEEGVSALLDTLEWRENEGKEICLQASSAVEEATAGDSWNNDAVRNGAPHASTLNEFITPDNIVETSSRPGDLVSCIRAGSIDDKALMSQLSAEQVVDFFLYCREVNSLVANQRSLTNDKLVYVITANDLTGTSLLSDATFRKAISAASTKGSSLYPGLSGPTLLLNLPPLLGALVKLFTPLFPPEVRAKIKFESGPLKGIESLSQIVTQGSDREKFLDDLDTLVYN